MSTVLAAADPTQQPNLDQSSTARAGTTAVASDAKDDVGGDLHGSPLDALAAEGSTDHREQRIQSRRLRMEAKRQVASLETALRSHHGDAAKRLGGIVNRVKTQEATPIEAKAAAALPQTAQESKSVSQVEASKKHLASIKNQTSQLITNILVAAQTRESQRRAEEKKRLDSIRLHKQNEKLKADSANQDIEQGWTLPPLHSPSLVNKAGNQGLSYGGPYRLMDQLNRQRDACQSLMEWKHKLVAEFQNELKLKDDDYVKEIKRQSTEIDLLIERMTSQHREIRKAVGEELEQIEWAFMQERNDMVGKFLSEAELLMDGRRQKESSFMDNHMHNLDEQIDQLEELRVQDTEDYNLTKVKLETDVQVLEQQLQQMRATYQLNSEKLEYNFQVLKKRDEENNVTISTQKRKINRLNDVVNSLRTKVGKQEDTYHKEYHQLSEDYKRVMEQFNELRKKFRRFQYMDNRKYQDLWEMNEEEAQELLRKIVTADRFIWESVLQAEWKCSDEFEHLLNWDAHRNALLQDKPHQSKPSLLTASAEAVDETAAAALAKKSDKKLSSSFTEHQLWNLIQSQSTKEMLDLLTSEAASFLVEEKLQKLLAPLSRDEQNLMKLDSIFKALEIKTTHDVERLQNYFYKRVEGALETKRELIDANDVIRALRSFVEDGRKQNEELQLQQGGKKHTGREVDVDQDKIPFWKGLNEAMDQKKFRVWESLYQAMQNYNGLLSHRIKTKEEVEQLRQQNADLNYLLQQHLQAEMNQDLVIPPSQVLFRQQ